ncbi:MAG: hypothetical protein FWF23_06335, partial [Alphaproteobacteria bacterium]|nr:hypothetical protein [Alphaproteobacteria bacterium]
KMAIGDISLTAAARSNLQALQKTTSLLETTQLRLATGKKVNSANDDAVAFFASKGFLNTANNLATIKDTISTAVETLTSFNNTIESIAKVVSQLQGLVVQALGTTNTDTRLALSSQYDDLVVQMNHMILDATFNGVNMLNEGDTTNQMIIYFNEDNSTALSIQGVGLLTNTVVTLADGTNTATAAVIATEMAAIDTAINAWANTTDLQSQQGALLTAMSFLTSEAAKFGGNATLLATRQTFTANMINSLSNASSRLTAADVNEEGANMQALQAQSQLGIVSLGVSGMLAGAILRIL